MTNTLPSFMNKEFTFIQFARESMRFWKILGFQVFNPVAIIKSYRIYKSKL